MVNVPTTLLPALRALNAMLNKFWPEQAGRIPLAFWTIMDDALLFDALQYLPINVLTSGGFSGRGHSENEIEALPEGFRELVRIFHLEDEFANEGWQGLSNLGIDGIRRVIAGYEIIGLNRRAQALRRVLAAFQSDPEDEVAFKQAAGEDFPDLVDDDESFQVIVKYLRADPSRRFGVIPAGC